MTQNKIYKIYEIASLLGLDFHGDGDCEISGIGSLGAAKPGQLSFLSNRRYTEQLAQTQASVVIIEKRHLDSCETNALVSSSPYVSFARATELFKTPLQIDQTIHPSASINGSVNIPDSVSIGPNVVIEEGVCIGANTVIGANSSIGCGTTIGQNCHFYPNVTVYCNTKIGDSAIFHSGAVIGSDGFGFAFDGEKSIKIHQLGGVRIGDEVEVGACSTIDRGALEDTIIGDGVKIDNQVQIGHNCKIGEHSVICGCVGIAGSVVIGKNCIMGGGSGAVGHIEIADNVHVSAMSLVSESIDEVGTYSSGTWQMKTSEWKRSNVRFQQLDGMYKRIKKLEKNK
ncbi:UDP-3-O-(3-hydroxymyristoyl)glucosamine N-acyltransferase [Gammaproteobacteria bacterium]|nr:UDP-3-O-(3-hydroxymyristoyl)glucosamine N-acyltransferase [Gammaproteobacteria bacterium]